MSQATFSRMPENTAGRPRTRSRSSPVTRFRRLLIASIFEPKIRDRSCPPWLVLPCREWTNLGQELPRYNGGHHPLSDLSATFSPDDRGEGTARALLIFVRCRGPRGHHPLHHRQNYPWLSRPRGIPIPMPPLPVTLKASHNTQVKCLSVLTLSPRSLLLRSPLGSRQAFSSSK